MQALQGVLLVTLLAPDPVQPRRIAVDPLAEPLPTGRLQAGPADVAAKIDNAGPLAAACRDLWWGHRGDLGPVRGHGTVGTIDDGWFRRLAVHLPRACAQHLFVATAITIPHW